MFIGFLLTTYASSTIASWIIMAIGINEVQKRFKQEGYKYVSPAKTKLKKFLDAFYCTIAMLIPIFNIYAASSLIIDFDKYYNRVKNNMLKKGSLKTKDQLNDNKVEIDLYTDEMNRSRKYSELSNDEKLRLLEEEREKLLKQENASNKKKPYKTKSYTTESYTTESYENGIHKTETYQTETYQTETCKIKVYSRKKGNK